MGSIFSTEIHIIHFEQLNCLLNSSIYNTSLINTLSIDRQDCLIYKSIQGQFEQTIIASLAKTSPIIIYGINHNDKSPYHKYNQLYKLGYTNVSVYSGGLCEWVLLSEYYGRSNFKLTADCVDLLTLK
mgnify:CR=1 FL=1